MSQKEQIKWNRILGLFELERQDILRIFYYSLFAGAVSLSLPLGVQAIINLIQGAQVSTSWVVLMILVMIGLGFAGTLQIMQMRIIETMQQRIFTRSSFELSYRFPKIEMQALRQFYPPELANRFFDTITLQKGLSKILIDVPAAVIQIVFAVILLSFYHPFFILFGLVLITLMYFVFKYTVRRGLQTSLKESKHKYRVAHWIQEVARSVVSFKISGNTSLALKKNDNLVADYLQAREAHFQIIKLQYLKMIAFKVIVTGGLLLIGGALVLNQQMNIGQFVASEIIILLVIASVEKLIVSLETLYDMVTSLEKLGQVVDLEMESPQGKTPDFNQGMNIELKDVAYKVQDKEDPILENVQLKLSAKSRTLIRGASGSGKSSLLRIIAGVNKTTAGTVYINDQNLRILNLNHYRSFLGLSLSEERPFGGTLWENVTFGRQDVDEAYLNELLDLLELRSYLKSLPDGWETIINPEGRHFSYTTAKKIILLRALLKKPKVLLLEDSLDQCSALETQKIIQYLCQSSHPWTIIVVSNNPIWEAYCDQVVELVDGTPKIITN